MTTQNQQKIIWVAFTDMNNAQDVMDKAEKQAYDISFIAKKDAIGSLTSKRDVIGVFSFPDVGLAHVYGPMWNDIKGYKEEPESLSSVLTQEGLFEKEARTLEHAVNMGGIVFRIRADAKNEPQIRSLTETHSPLYISEKQ